MSISYKRKLKPSNFRSLLIALFIGGGFAQFFPILGLGIIFAMMPGITDIFWGIAQLPVLLFSPELPEQDKTGHILVFAGRVYGFIVFILVFYLLRRLDFLAEKEDKDLLNK
jgi:hypothetical protein